ncbi:hypothetical protein CQA53_09820 [Helicobacter didelphidarum]|uniref:N-acetylmuramoyl-L-alanine amidase n=1 Tax=Helicobacter didelphidarum TaxID=2040648 RepID=A0A3D8I9T7_9HELI|nr:N-acetylmuramoyl-L-alanine amidase [Helicobacter didelphidarum]RDU61726.1 hypothetical protein CQA53_09820 [Helicobacter didelphidarum]
MSSNPLAVFFESHTNTSNTKLDAKNPLILYLKTYYDKRFIGNDKQIKYAFALINTNDRNNPAVTKQCLKPYHKDNNPYGYIILEKEQENITKLNFKSQLTLKDISYNPTKTNNDSHTKSIPSKAISGTDISIKLYYDELKDRFYKDLQDKRLIIFAICPNIQDDTLLQEQPQSPSMDTSLSFDFPMPISLRFNGEELQVLEYGEVKRDKVFKLDSLSLSNPKEMIKESKEYRIEIDSLLPIPLAQQHYTLNVLDSKNDIVATITNHNTQNIINPEILLDDRFSQFADILLQYKQSFGFDRVRLEVESEEEKIVVIDAGHGGTDVGATRNNIYEKTLALSIAKKLQNRLTNYQVYMTRETDKAMGINERYRFANTIQQQNPDKEILFVSIHINSSLGETTSRGIEVLYYDHKNYKVDNLKATTHQLNKTEKSIKLGNILRKKLNRFILRTNFIHHQDKVGVIKRTNMPAILIECGFINNTQDRELLISQDYQNKLATSFKEAIDEYFN